MKEQLISFETAKLAKEKGFNIPTESYYEYSLTEQEHEYDGKSGPFGWDKGELNCQRGFFINNWKECDGSNENWYMCSAPTQSLLQKWLREVHGIDVIVLLSNSHRHIYIGEIWQKIKDRPVHLMNITDFNTYEETLEAGLQEALKLIQ